MGGQSEGRKLKLIHYRLPLQLAACHGLCDKRLGEPPSIRENEAMKLYNMNLSNFATKSRIAIYDKGLNVEIVPIPGSGPASPEYRKVNPIGKIPCLDADGLMIPESEVINEYLEEKFPSPALLPRTPEGKAQVRLFTRLHDLYLEPPLRALFAHLNPKARGLRPRADDVLRGQHAARFRG